MIHTCVIRRMVDGVFSVCPTWVVSFLASILRPEGEIRLRQEQCFLQAIRRFLQRKPNRQNISFVVGIRIFVWGQTKHGFQWGHLQVLLELIFVRWHNTFLSMI